MDKPSDQVFEDAPGLDGPDYVALVIEWDQLADSLDEELALEELEKTLPVKHGRRWGRSLGLAAGAIGMLALAGWGLHRLRA
jgi:hypothetical protein